MRTTERPDAIEDLKGSARLVSAGAWAGILSGFLIGGVGGRLAMLVLRLTSDPAIRGVETDDGFVIGDFSTATLFLLALTTVLGLVGGLIYLAIRDWLPLSRRPLLMAAFYGAVGGALVIKPGGLDFTVLDPLPQALVMFVAIPAVYGGLLAVLTERFVASAPPAREMSPWKAFLPLAGFLLAGPVGVVILAVLGAGWWLDRKIGVLRMWSSSAATTVGRAVLVAASLLGAFDIVRDALEIL